MLSGLALCLSLQDWKGLGVLETVLYGSTVRGDFVPGCSDVDLFLVTASPLFDPRPVESLVRACLYRVGVEARGVDVAWCYLDELLAGACTYKFLTVYRRDFEENHIILHGPPLHKLQPPTWDPVRRARRLLNLARRPGMRAITAGEAVKLVLVLAGYKGPWDKWSVLEAVQRLGDECMVEVWRAYLECMAETGCLDRVLARLERLAHPHGSRSEPVLSENL